MSTLTFKGNELGASAPTGGLWRRAADLYWTGWSQYAASMNQDTRLVPRFPLYAGGNTLTDRAAARIVTAPLVDRAA